MAQLILRRYLVNDQILEGSGIYDASGNVEINLGQAPSSYYVEVERLTIDSGLGATDVTVYAISDDSTVFIRERFLFGTDTITEIDESSPIRFRPSEQMIVVLTGGTAGDQAIVYLQAWTVLYNPETLREEVGPGTVVTAGIHEIGPQTAPDPDGWN